MNNKMLKNLEFNQVLKQLEDCALSVQAKEHIRALVPYLKETEINRHLRETTEAKLIIEKSGDPPLTSMTDLEKSLGVLGKGILLTPEQLENIAQFLATCRRLQAYLKRAESTETAVASYGLSLNCLTHLLDEIEQAVRGGRIDDKASPALASLRRKIIQGKELLRNKLDALLRNNPNWFSESFVAQRNGHFTLPVKKEYKSRVHGSVIDISQSGGTYFIEPAVAQKIRESVSVLRIEEDNEVKRILYTLTALVEDELPQLRINIEAMTTLDFIFAKAKLSRQMDGKPLPISPAKRIELRGARHPLLEPNSAVPLDFYLGGKDARGLIITGPNTGGKTVALKTVGLLSLMGQSGLHVPARDGQLAMHNLVLSDIGDGQSIAENLSTFSSHMTNIIQILKMAGPESLVLLDELGSGTDPNEGMGLAVAIIEELISKNCLFTATTHYPEIKAYAEASPALVNARMAFDLESLLPLYQLEIGQAGESCALHIASRLGLPQEIVQRAGRAAYGREGAPVPMQTQKTGATIGSLSKAKTIEAIAMETGQGADVQSYSQATPRIVLQPVAPAVPDNPCSAKFTIGDSVILHPQKLIGIVYQPANAKGEVGIQVKNKKLLINHKRLTLHVSASQLYPENYDFSIVFDSAEVRKKRHTLERKHDASVILES
jgi:dsDNA-specific endonuclease/ATPase MutS2